MGGERFLTAQADRFAGAKRKKRSARSVRNDEGRERAGRGQVETRRQKLEIGKERTETPHRSRCRAYGAYLGATYFGT